LHLWGKGRCFSARVKKEERKQRAAVLTAKMRLGGKELVKSAFSRDITGIVAAGKLQIVRSPNYLCVKNVKITQTYDFLLKYQLNMVFFTVYYPCVYRKK